MYKSRFLFSVILLLAVTTASGRRVLRVLAIGNSFSVDAVEQHLYELAQAQGDSLVIGNAYIGGCSLDRHWNNVQTGKRDYQYRKVVGGTLTNRKNACIEEIVMDEPWDIVTLQQCSPTSGLDTSYTHLYDLADYVRKMGTNLQMKLGFHKTWAYAKNSTHKAFPNYGKSQFRMFRAIQEAVHKEVLPEVFSFVIPSAEAIQYGRTLLADTLNRDGYHLSRPFGRYLAACVWCEALTGKDITKNPWRPLSVDAQSAEKARRAAHMAMIDEKRTEVRPHYWADGLFFATYPLSSDKLKKKTIKSHGQKLIVIKNTASLPDSIKCLSIPEYKVTDIAAWQRKIQKKLKKQ